MKSEGNENIVLKLTSETADGKGGSALKVVVRLSSLKRVGPQATGGYVRFVLLILVFCSLPHLGDGWAGWFTPPVPVVCLETSPELVFKSPPCDGDSTGICDAGPDDAWDTVLANTPCLRGLFELSSASSSFWRLADCSASDPSPPWTGPYSTYDGPTNTWDR